MRTVLAGLLLVISLPAAALADCTASGLSLCISVNPAYPQIGQTLNLSATVTPGATSSKVDVYLILLLPTGAFLFLQGDGTFTPISTPFIAGWSPTSFSGTVFSYTFGGGEPGGWYTWYAGLARSGTLNLIGNFTGASFQFLPPPANLNGNYTLTGTITQSGCSSGFNGTFSSSGKISLSQSGQMIFGTGTLVTPSPSEYVTLFLSGTVIGNTISGSFSSIGSMMTSGIFNGILTGNTLALTISSRIPPCFFILSIAGNRE